MVKTLPNGFRDPKNFSAVFLLMTTASGFCKAVAGSPADNEKPNTRKNEDPVNAPLRYISLPPPVALPLNAG